MTLSPLFCLAEGIFLDVILQDKTRVMLYNNSI